MFKIKLYSKFIFTTFLIADICPGYYDDVQELDGEPLRLALHNFTNADQCGNYADEGDCFNREHPWPKNWFNEGRPMNMDLFHTYSTDGYVNGMRSNHPYGEVASTTQTS